MYRFLLNFTFWSEWIYCLQCQTINLLSLTSKRRRVKRENSEFKILNFTSHKKFYFHCLAKLELKPHTKVLKNLFSNMALKNLYETTIYSIFEFTQKQVFHFLKTNPYTDFFKIPLWRKLIIFTSYFLTSSKNLKWKQHFHASRFWNYQLLNMAVWWG